MRKPINFVFGTIVSILLGIGTLLPSSLYAQDAWQVSYWNNRTLSGAPVLTRQEQTINNNWVSSSPDPRVGNDDFSARWSRTEQLGEGTYRFTVTADDGIRVWLNGVRILDDWQIGVVRTRTIDLYLTAGTYETRVEYFEASGLASVTFARQQLTDNSAPTPQPTTVAIESPAFGATYWRATYFGNTTLAGDPTLVRNENNIDFTWGSGSPAPGIIPVDRFSARWTRSFDLDAARYRFAVTADDGVRLYVNDYLLIDEWHDESATTHVAEIDLAGGATAIRIEYYENYDQAVARFSYAKIIGEDGGSAPPLPETSQQANWRGEYYDSVNLSGEPKFVRTDRAINFDWGTGSPAPNQLGSDRFSVRWSDTLSLTPGRYRFTVTVDDGVRLRINGETVIDRYTVQSARTFSVERNLAEGRATVVMEYFENTGEAVAQFSWQRVGTTTGATNDSVSGDSVSGASVSDSIADYPGAFAATVVGTANLNARSGPGVNYGVVTMLGGAQRVAVIGRNRTTSWVQVALGDGRTAWVNRRYLSSDNAYRTLPVTG